MRYLIMVALVLVTGCASVPDPDPSVPALAPEEITVRQSGREAEAMFRRVTRRVEPVAERICREKHPRAKTSFCDFRVLVDTEDKGGPNAYQTIGRDGRPIIAFNVAMLATAKNDDEIAFIMGHEAAHQIGKHIEKMRGSSALGGALAGALIAGLGGPSELVSTAQNIGQSVGARAYSQEHELEADILGTYIAEIAGYDADLGSQSFARFSGGGGFLATHPPSQLRRDAVVREVRKIKAAQAAGRPIKVP